MDLNINVDELNENELSISSIKSTLSDLANAMSKIDLDELDLQSISLYKDAKSAVDDAINGDFSLDELKIRIKKTRELLNNVDNNANELYNQLDDMSYEEFGNYIDDISLLSNYSDGMTINIEDYLEENYSGKYTKLDNGGYYLKLKNGDEYYFSEDCTLKDVNLVAYYPGASYAVDKGKDTIRSEMEENGVPSGYVYAIANSCDKNNSGDSNPLKTFDEIALDLDISGWKCSDDWL